MWRMLPNFGFSYIQQSTDDTTLHAHLHKYLYMYVCIYICVYKYIEFKHITHFALPLHAKREFLYFLLLFLQHSTSLAATAAAQHCVFFIYRIANTVFNVPKLVYSELQAVSTTTFVCRLDSHLLVLLYAFGFAI